MVGKVDGTEENKIGKRAGKRRGRGKAQREREEKKRDEMQIRDALCGDDGPVCAVGGGAGGEERARKVVVVVRMDD
jgi:hypothetical protein